ncbi:MAG TPA: C45 family autoproteolytic acyltransferase/hydrolase [Bryobacteraceae bacterium]|nr:C45 family autoproteolytic acyltransferase/hydrolase [Bryobacteraceae bacterium]
MRQLLLSLACVVSLSAATAFQASFENANNGWTVLHGTAVTDSSVTYQSRKSMRLEPGTGLDASVRSASIPLSIGKRYELSGWIRTDKLAVRDVDRSPIAIGASIAMASMPYDVHSEAVGGTHDWTRVHLRFTATAPQDSIVLTAGKGGAFEGKAWFAGITVDEVSSKDDWPSRAAVTTFGPAYRYPTGGWVYLHIEGQPYERGYQHGHLMAKEVVQYLERCAAELDSKGKNESWDLARTTANALFLRGFDQEILAEMKGIAEGASDAGSKWQGRRIDLIDMVAANTTVELGELTGALPVTPTGLEGLHLESPVYFDRKRDVSIVERCSAFAANGKATRDGRMVIGHITMWPLTLAEQTNVMLDIQPTTGHRLLMQSYPGGIESGTDWYQNDAGIVLTETTIRQSPFNIEGTPIAYRARKAIQYGDTIDKVVEILSTKNNGLYTNEWLIGDAKNNEIAMFEMGTYKSRLYRSSKNDWFEGTDGFYWGDNNAKDLAMRLELQPDPKSEPVHVPYVPGPRDLKWKELYQEYSGKIDDQFAFLAFRTAPLVTASSMDAKVATADMASHMMVWGVFGKPNQREWVPSSYSKEQYAKNDGIYSSGYRLIAAEPSESLKKAVIENELARTSAKPEAEKSEKKTGSYKDRLWKGWVLPASSADDWFTAGSAAYYRDLQSDDLAKAMGSHWAAYRSANMAEPNAMNKFAAEAHRGALVLDQMRREMGDDKFFKLMTDFFAAHTTQTVTSDDFVKAAGVSATLAQDKGGAVYMASDIFKRLSSAMIVYGTVADAGANRYAAEQLQKHYMDQFESAVPVRKDFALTDDELRDHDVIFIGRPETNSALAAWKTKIGLESDGGSFRIAGKEHASETEALAFAATNPLDRHHMVLVLAGNNALETVHLASGSLSRTEYTVYESGKESSSGFRN